MKLTLSLLLVLGNRKMTVLKYCMSSIELKRDQVMRKKKRVVFVINANVCNTALPLALKNWNTCKNEFTKHLQDLVRSPYILFSYNMLHLQEINTK